MGMGDVFNKANQARKKRLVDAKSDVKMLRKEGEKAKSGKAVSWGEVAGAATGLRDKSKD